MPADSAAHRINVHLDGLLARRNMTLTELAARIDLTVVNLSVLKNGRARAIRFSTLTAICEALQCQPGDILSYDHANQSSSTHRAADHEH
jgi:putative transcriptional regulator